MGFAISQVTAYRYLNEAIEVLAAKAPSLREALEKAIVLGLAYLILDGTLVGSDWCAGKKASRKGREIGKWYSGKAHHPAGNAQALTTPRGVPLWVADVLPCSTHGPDRGPRARPVAGQALPEGPAFPGRSGYAYSASGLVTLGQDGFVFAIINSSTDKQHIRRESRKTPRQEAQSQPLLRDDYADLFAPLMEPRVPSQRDIGITTRWAEAELHVLGSAGRREPERGRPRRAAPQPAGRAGLGRGRRGDPGAGASRRVRHRRDRSDFRPVFAVCGSVRGTWLWLRDQGLKFLLQSAPYIRRSEIIWTEFDLPCGARRATCSGR